MTTSQCLFTFQKPAVWRLVTVAWLASMSACGRQTSAGSPGEGRGKATEIACERTPDCRGGEFCDRGVCAKLGTYADYGHGYGAQCVGEEFYPKDKSGSLRDLHCRSYECVDGHCSSCTSEAECDEGYVCAPAPNYPEYPDRPADYPGRRCTLRALVDAPPVPCGVPENPVPCAPTKPEQPEPPLVANEVHECQEVEDCRGDEFCDRGRCAPITVSLAGQGYGATLIRREPPSLQDVCLGFLSIGHWCSSCLADSECYPEAPYCIRHPTRPEGRSCAPHPELEYYDVDGRVAPSFSTGLETPAEWLANYRGFQEYHERYRQGRAEVGLPVPPALPLVADGLP